MASKTGKVGRPTAPAKQGEKTTLSLRVTPEMKRRLDDAATSSGRNLSQETEIRLEFSFRDEGMLREALVLAYGSEIAEFLFWWGDAMRARAADQPLPGQDEPNILTGRCVEGVQI
jgi:hypothetical protein